MALAAPYVVIPFEVPGLHHYTAFPDVLQAYMTLQWLNAMIADE